MQFDKWTVEGVVKSVFSESILQRNTCVIGEECVGTLRRERDYSRTKVVPLVYVYLTCPCFLYKDRFFLSLLETKGGVILC